MKLQNTDREVLTNSQKESKFTINASAQAFKILSDGLYEHKIAAIVRELSCNAYDAHVENGNQDEPFKVVLPNNLHPYFEIEDYGIGLDDEGVREVYTSYFTSTKNDSNDAIGAFGLGSKTPFSYTTSFTIRARKNGMERLYTAYIGADGAPCVNMVMEKATEETSGVKIAVPVKEHDFFQFKHEASFILSFFKTQPIVNDPNFSVAVPDVISELDEDGMVTRQIDYTGSSLYTGKIYAVMGGVCYKLDEFWIRNEVASQYLNSIVLGSAYSSSRATLFIKFDIGELEVAASRETLSLDEETKVKVIDRIRSRVQKLKEKDQQKINATGHMVKALRRVVEQYNLGPLSYSVFSYNDVDLRKISYKKVLKCLDVEVFKDTRTDRKKKVTRSGLPTIEELATAETIVGLYYTKDQKKSAIIKHGRKVTPDKEDGIALVFNEPLSNHQRTRIETIVGRSIEWNNLQDLKDEEKRNRVSNPGTTGPKDTDYIPPNETTVRAKSVVLTNDSIDYKNSTRIDVADGKVYYKTSNIYLENCISIDGMRIYINALQYILSLYDIDELVIVYENWQNEKKLERNKVPDIKEFVKTFITDYEEDLKNAAYNFKCNISTSTDKLLEVTKDSCSKKYEDFEKKLTDFTKNAADEVEKFVKSVNNMYTISRMVDLDFDAIDKHAEEYSTLIHDYKKTVLDTYPMIEYVINRYILSDLDKDRIKDYIRMVDSQADSV